MGDRGTFKSGDSMSSHSKDSMDIINRIVTLSISCMRDLANPHEGTFVDMPFKDFMYAIEHIRETIEEWEVMCDELDDDISELRKTIEILAGNCPYRNEYCDLTDCAGCKYAKINVIARQQKELEVLHAIIKDRDSIIESFRKQSSAQHDVIHDRDEIILNLRNELKQEREKSNQLEKECSSWEERCTELKTELSRLKAQYGELAKQHDKNSDSVTYWKCKCHQLETQIADLTEERDYYQDCMHKLANRASNFCGNCAHYAQMGKDNDEYEGICTQHYIKRVDPDDASCSHFKSNQTDRVVIGKPEFPCCEHCSHDDCDNCTLCPF